MKWSPTDSRTREQRSTWKKDYYASDALCSNSVLHSIACELNWDFFFLLFSFSFACSFFIKLNDRYVGESFLSIKKPKNTFDCAANQFTEEKNIFHTWKIDHFSGEFA